ncbi:hypothetical protein JRQ81_012306 [Phrynocephalus forsythii]|uniref:BED-type domain-containing protein n=1 Tax=Phrynocephalus forsythii TaxID=171643 RepID=A0A9Q1APX3_9SAUR|nr:hypothetical protein JRQ81_012306 [Phrynocephalus forsythii]
MEVPSQWGLDTFEEMAVHFTAFHGGGLGAVAKRDFQGGLWSCGDLPALSSASGATAGAGVEAGATPSDKKASARKGEPCTAAEAPPQEDSTDDEEMEHQAAATAGRQQQQQQQQVPWAGFEKVFTFVRQKGKNVVVQCNCCLPAIKHLSSAINSSSNLRKHLEP